MKKLFFFLITISYYCTNGFAQTISIQPYLQDATPHSIYILWETDTNDESIVEWGLTEQLGKKSVGTAFPSKGHTTIHQVALTGLQRFTKYYYRVKTGTAVSKVFHFKTPPFASDNQSFRLVAMSDMQRDWRRPNKFKEIVEKGVMNYMKKEYGGDLVDNLAFVMIPGDLVTTGTNFEEWQQTFFNPAEKLFSQVPVYPVLGNHEKNTKFYFSYFKLPENGTPGFEEHWWHKDYGNLRMIGLDSNDPYDGAEQLKWLDNLLAATCKADSIDFVFAQLHHPHKSELWIPGESDFTGEVIKRLEQFSTDCGKPSLHFFGHTHGYSRGQSRDHKHLWINVATAGGAIDNWGEFLGTDYEEFAVSQDDYGFVTVEVNDDANPTMLIKRISRGDQDTIINNLVTDTFVLRKHPEKVNKPIAMAPIEEQVMPECVTLIASDFAASNPQASHGQSHWQIAHQQKDFANPVVEKWKNHENWYYEIDFQAEDQLTDEAITGLEELTTYWWRVRYRDKELNWSDWSDAVSFNTGKATPLPNLIANPSAEKGLEHWQIAEGKVAALKQGDCQGIQPNKGKHYFSVGGLCNASPVAKLVQKIAVTKDKEAIDAGDYIANFGGYFSNYDRQDMPEMKIVFLDQKEQVIGSSPALSTLNNAWTKLNHWENIPTGTRFIQVELKGSRNKGKSNDAYFDDLFLIVGNQSLHCDQLANVKQNIPLYISSLKIKPNPMKTTTKIKIPDATNTNLILNMVNSEGDKVQPVYSQKGKHIILKKGNLPTGTYTIYLRSGKKILGMGKVKIIPQ